MLTHRPLCFLVLSSLLFPQTAEGSAQPFNSQISLSYFVDQCADIFGVPGLTPNIQYTNDFYGGNQIVTSNTIFTDGTIDPWHILGNYQSYQTGSGAFTTLINGTAHCAGQPHTHPRHQRPSHAVVAGCRACPPAHSFFFSLPSDLYTPQPDDLPGLTAARAQANAQIALWLNGPNPLKAKAHAPAARHTKIVLKE